MSNNWKQKLTPYDDDLCRMVSNLTGKECEPKNGGNHFFISVDYSGIKDADYISSMLDAIQGRVGDRFISMTDESEKRRIIVRIGFSKSKYPSIIRPEGGKQEQETKGKIYCRKLQEVMALQVTRDNLSELVAFVGSGEMEIDGEGAVFSFINRWSVYQYANEGDYIVMLAPGQFKVVPREDFEKDYELR